MANNKPNDNNGEQEIVYSADELVRNLQISFDNKHSLYYYYTTVSTLARMLKNNMFRLSNIKSLRLNDQREAKEFGDKELWERICIGCFSADRMENNAMWRAYGNPADEAIAIRIPSSILEEMTHSMIGVELNCWKSKLVLDEDLPLKLNWVTKGVKILCHKIAYFPNITQWDDEIDKGTTLNIYRDYNQVASFDIKSKHTNELSKLVGYVKRWQWMYEREVRLSVVLPAKFARKNAFLKLPDNFFRKVSVVLGPCFDIEKCGVRDTLKQFLDRCNFDKRKYAPLLESAYCGQLNYSEYGNGNKTKMPSLIYHGKNACRKSLQAYSLYEQYVRMKDELESRRD